jgi:hypothetical protein
VYGKEQLKDRKHYKRTKKNIKILIMLQTMLRPRATEACKPFGGWKMLCNLKRNNIHGMWSDINVYLFGGEYYLDKTLVLTPEDSGKNGFKITYASYPGEKAELSAAKEITGWKPYKDGIYMVQLPRGTEYNVIYENGTFARKARHPNHSGIMRDSYLKVAKTDEIQPSGSCFGAGKFRI